MRTTYAKVKYALKGLLLSDEPLLEAVLIVAKSGQISSIAYRMGMKVWIKQRILMDPENKRSVVAWWVGIKALPDNWRP